LTWSILLYAGAALASGYATSLPELLFLRCLTFIGVSVEFVRRRVAGGAVSDPKQREGSWLYAGIFVAGWDHGD